MTIDELLANRDAGLRHLIDGMGFTRSEAVHLFALLATEHAEQHPDLPTAPGQVGNRALAPRAVRAPAPHTTPAVGVPRSADRRRHHLLGELARGALWTVLAWIHWHRSTPPSVPTWTEPERANLQRLADNADATTGDG